jgi:signal transduction histidine kinase/ActR/RegA family two-component response regulator
MGTEMASSETAPQALAPDFRALFESLPGLHLVLTPDMKIVAASEAYLRATLAKREAVVGRSIFDVFPERSDEHEAAGIRNLRASLERVIMYKLPDAMDVQKFNVRAPNSDSGVSGVRYWIPVNSPVLGTDGEVAYIIHQVQDLTGFVGLPQGEPAPAEVHPERELHEPPAEAGSPPRGHDVHEANWLLEKAYQELAKLSEELEARVAERTAQLAEANAKLESELAERKRLEHQLLHSQKLEAVRRLAGGVAHDFNNLLTILQGYSELIVTQSQAGTSQREQLLEITRASEGAAVLTRQLLAFSRQQLLDVRVIDLNSVVDEVEKMLRRSIGEDVELVTVLGKSSCRIKADVGQIEQILLNLVVNARDAMPKGGKLTIETSTVDLGAAYSSKRLGVTPGPYVVLAVSDTGVGMSLEIQEHIFEPFFSTKPKGKGAGLGLSTAYGVIKQSGGNIWVDSEIGHGSTFRIFLPRVAESVEAEPVTPPAQTKVTRLEGNETILLVEDEDGVRSLLRRALKSMGYTVLEARLSTEALDVLQQAGKPVDLVLTDVVMPGMSGPALAEKVKAVNPGVKLVYMSGYSDDTLLRHGLRESGEHFIQKPFGPADLIRKIREVLDAPEDRT